MSSIGDMIASLRNLDKIEERTAAIAAPMLEQKLKATAASGSTPDGKPWAPTKRGGERPMKNAAKAISVKAYGNVVRATLTGPEVFHHYGARGEPRRQVIPDNGGATPAAVQEVLDAASAQAFDELTGGR